MDSDDRLMDLWRDGLASEGIGPEVEWHPVPINEHQLRHHRFWATLDPMLTSEYGDDPEASDEDLPEWMSERAVDLLANNDN